MGRRKKSIGSAKASVCTMAKLGKLLNNVTTGEGESKQEAELEIQKIEGARVYPIHLTQIVLDPNCRVEVRILASEKLKKIVETHWCSEAKSFLPPEIDSKNKEKMKSLLLTGLLESDKEIQKAVVGIITTIIQWDWPDNWAGLIQTLVTYLNKEIKSGVHGGLMVLKYLKFGRSDPDSLNNYAVILREINRIFADENQYLIEIRSLACDIISDKCYSLVGLKQSDMILQYLQSEVSQFCAAAIPSWKSDKSDIQLKTAILEVFKMLLDNIPKCIFSLLPEIVPLVWESLIDCAKYYHTNIVNAVESKDDETVEGSEEFVEMVLEFIECTLTGGRWSFTKMSGFELSRSERSYLQDSFILPHTLRHLIALMELTADQIERWNTDIDDFVEQEGLKTHVFGIRGTIEYLILDLMKMKKYALVDALTLVIMKHLNAENEIRAKCLPGADQESWQSHEAILLAFGTLKESIISKKIGKSPRYDVVPILKNIVLADLNNPGTNPFLVGRCLCIGGLYADLIPPEMASAFLKATLNCLQANRPTCMKIYAATALHSWYYRDNSRNERNRDNKKKNRNENEKILKSNVPALMGGLLSLAESQKSERLLTLILKSVATLMPFDKACTTSVVNRIYSLTEVALLEYHKTYAHHNPWLDVLMELMLNANCVNLVQQRLVQKLLGLMTDIPLDKSDQKSSKGSAALDIVDTLVECSPIPLSDLLIDDLFPACCKFVTNSDDWWTLDYGIVLMETYLITSFEQVTFYQDKKGRYGAQYVLQVITHVLNHKSKTQFHRMDNACGVLIMLINNVWPKMKVDADELLEALVFRMGNNKSLKTKRQLLLVYAYIMNEEFDTVLKFLATASRPPGQRSPLELVISEGFCREYYSFDGRYGEKMKISLNKIFRHGLMNLSSPLHQITFKEDSGENIPLLAKICRLMMNDQTSVELSGMNTTDEETVEM